MAGRFGPYFIGAAAAGAIVAAATFFSGQAADREMGSTRSDPQSVAGSVAGSCGEMWEQTRTELVGAGAPDGEARRQADLARAECEGEPVVPPSAAQLLPCASVGGDIAAVAGESVVYFSCMAEVGLPETAARVVRPIARPVNTSALRGDTTSRIEAALLAYFEGPTDAEKRAGFMTGVPTPIKDPLQHVRVDGKSVTVSLASTTADQIGSLPTAAADAFLIEMRATALQFDGLDELRLEVAGDCQAFWSLLQRTCQSLGRYDV